MSSSTRCSFTRRSGRDRPIQIPEPEATLFRFRQGFGPDADHLRRRGREPCGNPLERLARPDGEHGPFARLVRSPPPSDVGIDPRRLQLAGRRIFKAAATLTVAAQVGSVPLVSVQGDGCQLRDGAVHARAGAGCALASVDGDTAAVRWMLPDGAQVAGGRMYGQFVRRGEFQVMLSSDDGVTDALPVVIE